MKQKWLSRHVAALGPYLTLCLSEVEARAVAKHIGVHDIQWLNEHAHATTHFFINDNKAMAVVCLGSCENRTPVEVAALLVHEAVHVWQEYVLNIGECTPGAEQEAYAIQNISQTLMEEYARRINLTERKHHGRKKRSRVKA